MTARIKFHSFRFLFRLFDFLAEKSGGWALFVRPKLIFGSLIIGLGFTNCDSKTSTNKPQEPRKLSIKNENTNDSITTKMSTKKETKIKFLHPRASCYDTDVVYIDSLPADSIYQVVEQMPEFPGGQDSLFKYINKTLKYPNIDINVQGRVICRFAILSDGSISQTHILKGIHPLYEAEVIRIVKSMPKWIPGKQNGKAVPVWYTLPIMFALQEE